jgi:rhamnose transport system permease protein
VGNWVNLFQLSIEKIIVALVMTFIIINAEIDLSVASVMGLSACLVGFLVAGGTAMEVALLAGLFAGVAAGIFNSFWIGIVGLPSLVVTLAGLIGFRGLAYLLLEDRSIGSFPAWFNQLGQQAAGRSLSAGDDHLFCAGRRCGYHPAIFRVWPLCLCDRQQQGCRALLRRQGAAHQDDPLRGLVDGGGAGRSALCRRLGAVRGDMAIGFELDIITMVLLGGVSIFGGSGSLWGVLLSVLIILNLRNGMGLANMSGHVQTGVVGTLLILSVLLPNLLGELRARMERRRNEKSPITNLQSPV